MVKKRNKNNRKKRIGKGFNKKRTRARKINASTPFEECTEHLSPFGGLLGLTKFLDLFDFKKIFNLAYKPPKRKPKLGHYLMTLGILMLLFIGFNRIWHFAYIRLDAMLCGIFQVTRLPVASTFWRYLDSLGLNQANSLLDIMKELRERVWQKCDLSYSRIAVDIDTTVETIYGKQQGGKKGHNTKHRGMKGYRPVLCFIEQTREYLTGKLRTGETMSGKDAAKIIQMIKAQIPSCVREVLIRGDGEFFGWKSVDAALKANFDFIIAKRRCNPSFESDQWYRPWKSKDYEYNSCIYKPIGWEREMRFVAMRIPKTIKTKPGQLIQCPLFETDLYTYRVFCTNLGRKAHEVIAEYDKRADVENLIGESKREGLEAIPSGKFKNNYAFFQIVMLSYNIWRYMKILAEMSGKKENTERDGTSDQDYTGIESNTIRIARLKLLIIAAKVVTSGNRDKVKYSIHDSRTPALLKFYDFLDQKILKKKSMGKSKILDECYC